MIKFDSAKAQIYDYISNSFLFESAAINLYECQSFLEIGIIDSTGILELIEFLQNKFSIKIEDNEILPENFDSIPKILSYLTNKGLFTD
jgi:acyl carrier protein